ncbi:MAG: glycosyltransferase family 2 protein [Rhodococcus sp.]|nr:glycosyltransferase family 2 protein [Rhodococcus sp. (in: high G+C Gram-positive bacteria)]
MTEATTVWPVRSGRHAQRGATAAPNVRVSAIIPTYNEAANLPYLLPHLPRWLHEVIIVDGRSTDDTVAVARELLPDVKVVLEPEKGKGIALRRGFQEATGDILVMMDADGSMNPAEIGLFVRQLRDGADFVKGSRFMQGAGSSDISRLRWLGNLGFTVLVKLRFGGRYTDLCYGYAAFWRSVLPELDLDGVGFEIETQMNIRALRARLNIFEVPSFEFDRQHGESNLRTFPDGWRVLKTIFRESVRPIGRHKGLGTRMPARNT